MNSKSDNSGQIVKEKANDDQGNFTLDVPLINPETNEKQKMPLMQMVHLLPFGAIVGRDGRSFYLGDPEKIISIFNNNNIDLVIDYEHQTEFAAKNGQPAPAAGWIKDLEMRDNGIWGLVEWTEKARQMIENKEYRFISPVMTYSRTSGEVMRLLHAGLTNKPNLELTALSSQQHDTQKGTGANQPADFKVLAVAVNSTQATMHSLNQIFGLDEDASPDDLVKAVNNEQQKHDNSLISIQYLLPLLRLINENSAASKSEERDRKIKSWLLEGKITPAMVVSMREAYDKAPEAISAMMEKAVPVLKAGMMTFPESPSNQKLGDIDDGIGKFSRLMGLDRGKLEQNMKDWS